MTITSINIGGVPRIGIIGRVLLNGRQWQQRKQLYIEVGKLMIRNSLNRKGVTTSHRPKWTEDQIAQLMFNSPRTDVDIYSLGGASRIGIGRVWPCQTNYCTHFLSTFTLVLPQLSWKKLYKRSCACRSIVTEAYMCVAKIGATPRNALSLISQMSHAAPPMGQLESHPWCMLWLRFQVQYNRAMIVQSRGPCWLPD